MVAIYVFHFSPVFLLPIMILLSLISLSQFSLILPSYESHKFWNTYITYIPITHKCTLHSIVAKFKAYLKFWSFSVLASLLYISSAFTLSPSGQTWTVSWTANILSKLWILPWLSPTTTFWLFRATAKLVATKELSRLDNLPVSSS